MSINIEYLYNRVIAEEHGPKHNTHTHTHSQAHVVKEKTKSFTRPHTETS